MVNVLRGGLRPGAFILSESTHSRSRDNLTILAGRQKFGWVSLVSSLIVAELTVIAVVVPIMMLRASPAGAYRPMAFLAGFAGTFVLGALLAFLEKLRDDPQATVGWVWELWKGRGGEK